VLGLGITCVLGYVLYGDDVFRFTIHPMALRSGIGFLLTGIVLILGIIKK
jgi:hypothetical protein